MTNDRDRTLTRDITATQIPSGDKHPLPAGTKVFLHQILGGSFTVQADHGLYRIDAADGDAIGETVTDHRIHTATLEDGSPNPEAIWTQLKKVYDPEIPVNIVDLGLVYSMDIEKLDASAPTPGAAAPTENCKLKTVNSGGSAAGYKVSIALTLTAPGCGMGPVIAEDARTKVLMVPGVTEAEVRITWEPPWNQSMISEEGKMKLGLI